MLVRHLPPPVIALLLLSGCQPSTDAKCERFAELMERCRPPEKRDVSLRICRGAHAKEGEQSSFDRKHAAYVRWLNATLRLQAECAIGAKDCGHFSSCVQLRAPR